MAPDEVILNFAVTTFAKEVDTAKSQNDDKIKKLLTVPSSVGIKQEDIQTDELRIQVRFGKDDRGNDVYTRIAGYEMTRGVTLHLRDISKFEPLLQSLVEAGVNHFGGIEFRSSQLRKHRDEARDLAIKAAREKAAKLAGALDQKVGRPLKIEEKSGTAWSGSNRAQVARDYDSGGETDDDSTFAPGRMAITARVSVVFELLD